MKLVIVGGVAGGASAATRARRNSEDAEIVLVERGPDVSFANCGMPYFIGDEITSREKLLVVSPERLRRRFRLDVRTLSNVESIDRAAKTVRIRDLRDNRVYDEPYDKLILAPGSAPIRPDLPGIDLPGIRTLRTLADADRIKERIDQGIKRAVIIGAGFIGLELAENFVRRGVAVTVVELRKQAIPTLDPEMATPIAETLRANGVDLRLDDSADGFEPEGDGLAVRLKSGARLSADLVVLGVGVRPESPLAVQAGLEVGPRGGIVVDRSMKTSDPDILAVGDAVVVADGVTGEPVQIPLAGPANRQGRIAADVAFGREAHYRGTQGTSIVRVFDQTAAMTGASERTLSRRNRPFQKVYAHPAHHAGYYPGAKPMSLKLLFDPGNGKILGAQVVGSEGVDKRVDVLAIAIQAGMTVFDLEEAELAYSPQYGSAKDPINMLGFIASGLIRGDHPQIDAVQLHQEMSRADSAPVLIDVRDRSEFEQGHIAGAVHIPLDELRSRLSEIPADRPVVAHCQVGQRGYLATRILLQKGFKARNLSGGYKSFEMTTRAGLVGS